MTRRKNKGSRVPEFEVIEEKIQEESKKILESVSKVVEPKKRPRTISKLTFWCTACTQKFTIHGKAEDGKFLKPQQICPHVTLQDYELLY